MNEDWDWMMDICGMFFLILIVIAVVSAIGFVYYWWVK